MISPRRLVGMCVVVGVMASAGCSKKRIPECDAFAATVDKIANCSKLPEGDRAEVQRSAKQIKDALQMIDDAGGIGDAPADLVNTLRDSCKTQDKAIVEAYSKLMPECLK